MLPRLETPGGCGRLVGSPSIHTYGCILSACLPTTALGVGAQTLGLGEEYSCTPLHLPLCGEEFFPNSLVAMIEVLFLDRPLCCLQPQLQWPA